MRTSWKDLGLLVVLVVMGTLVFGRSSYTISYRGWQWLLMLFITMLLCSLQYYIEGGVEGTGFTSIPEVPAYSLMMPPMVLEFT